MLRAYGGPDAGRDSVGGVEDEEYDDGTAAELRHPWLMWAQLALTLLLVVSIAVLLFLPDVTAGAAVVLPLFALLTASSIYGVTLKRR
ncbi:hypothetical protein GCM10010988_09150 [Cnuibacter physcomitrellae]|nr:hypothetical protein GCM10010988_09150 [Cnuibacter physcomitrellae]